MNALWLDHKFASLVGTQLEQFKVVKSKPYSARFRCPLCGDSERNKFKTRGYFYEYNGRVNMKCHNCGHSTSLSKFIETINPMLYSEYRLEYLKDIGVSNNSLKEETFVTDITKFATRRIEHFDPFKGLKKISQLSHNHPAKKYIVDRKIPPNTHYRIYYSPTYCNWVNEFVPNKFDEKVLRMDEPRIVFPFIDSRGYVFGFTGRSIRKESTLRYITIVLDESKDKIFGVDSINKNKSVYVVEGPIDSLFLENCIAMAGSDVRLDSVAVKENLIIIYDNEPRNKEIVAKINRMIDNGYRVCIWPSHIDHKDINDMVMSGMSGAAVQYIIDQNTFSGLSAKMHMNQWSKI
jgi:hypothetical protein